MLDPSAARGLGACRAPRSGRVFPSPAVLDLGQTEAPPIAAMDGRTLPVLGAVATTSPAERLAAVACLLERLQEVIPAGD